MSTSPEYTVYLCGPDEKTRQLIALEVQRILAVQGIHAKVDPVTVQIGGVSPGTYSDHFQRMRELRDEPESPEIMVKGAAFPNERVKEILDREAEDKNKPALLVRIHWGSNTFTDRIMPGRRYLVKCTENAWYTGTFRLASTELKPYWTFVEMDGREMLDGSPRRDLTAEDRKNGILEIYEIVQ